MRGRHEGEVNSNRRKTRQHNGLESRLRGEEAAGTETRGEVGVVLDESAKQSGELEISKLEVSNSPVAFCSVAF